MFSKEQKKIIEEFGLIELPEEGGFYKNTYQSKLMIDFSNVKKSIAGAIYYFITEEHFSALHKLKCDEMWHFYAGDPIEILVFNDSHFDIVELGNKNFELHKPQTIVPSHYWQGARLKTGGRWALLGTNTFPAYSQSNFELAKLPTFENFESEKLQIIKKYIRIS
ncbi:MAG: cupin domain-containing protein [Bacteriovoracaceae bacterium]|nr:cupin domain-containing protein [Bacteriovoracaceae bacterium]